MTTIDTRPDAAGSADAADAITSAYTTLADWVTTTDHKKIGRLFTGFGLVFLAAAAVLGAVLGFERADDSSVALDADALLQLFQAYRLLLVLGGLAPLAIGLSVAVAPIQVGARAIAFPRVALTGCYAWLGGIVLTLVGLLRNGGAGGGDPHAVDMFLAGQGLAIVGLVAAAGCVATTVLATRAPGMTMRRVPLFAWSALIGALAVLVALPVLFGAIVYVFVDHRLGASFNFGGAEGITAWTGWVLSTPAVAVFSLPAVGVAAELIPVTFRARQALRGVAFAGIALVGVTALAAATQRFAHTVTFDTDFGTFLDGLLPYLVFAGLPLLGLVVVMGLGGLTAKAGSVNGRPRISAPFVWSFLGLGMVFVGLIGNALVAITDFELIGTTFEEGATLYVVYGAAMALVGGLVFWAPKLSGRTVADARAIPLGLLAVLGTVLASLPLYAAGIAGQAGGLPSNDADVAAMLSLDGVSGGSIWVIGSLIGHLLVVLAIVATVATLMSATTGDGDAAEANPYGAHTIEWSAASPAPAHNYEHVVTVASAEPQFDLTAEGSRS